jgi:hypothetical protein
MAKLYPLLSFGDGWTDWQTDKAILMYRLFFERVTQKVTVTKNSWVLKTTTNQSLWYLSESEKQLNFKTTIKRYKTKNYWQEIR